MSDTHHLNVDFPFDDYLYLKKICARKGLPIRDFIIPLVLRAMDEEEDTILAKKARRRLKNLNPADLIPIDEAFKIAEWVIT